MAAFSPCDFVSVLAETGQKSGRARSCCFLSRVRTVGDGATITPFVEIFAGVEEVEGTEKVTFLLVCSLMSTFEVVRLGRGCVGAWLQVEEWPAVASGAGGRALWSSVGR